MPHKFYNDKVIDKNLMEECPLGHRLKCGPQMENRKGIHPNFCCDMCKVELVTAAEPNKMHWRCEECEAGEKFDGYCPNCY
jgi:hypothetical protein